MSIGESWALYWYAKNVIKSRWLEAEPLIGKRDASWGYYADEFGLNLTTHGDSHYEFGEIGEVK